MTFWDYATDSACDPNDDPFGFYLARRLEEPENGRMGVETFARSPEPVPKTDRDWWMDSRRKYLSMSLPIYALRNRQRPGIGKFTDLGRVYRDMLSRQGVDTVVLLPPFQSTFISPYSPASVYALNELYIDWRLLPEVEDGPLMKLTRTAEDPRWVHYDDELQRARRIRVAAYREFRNVASPFRRKRLDDFCANQARNRNWLDEYAWFMVEREVHADDAARREAAESHMFAQWVAYNQFQCALHHVHAAGGHVVIDIPLFRAAEGVDVLRHPEYFRSGHPGAGGQLWGDQSLWNWDKLRSENYRYLLEPMEHWLDFGCDGIRIDAAANAFRREGQSGGGDEDGESFMAELGKIFRGRGALALVEVLSAPEVTESVERHGMLALYRDWQVYSTHDFINVDLSCDPSRFLDEVRYLLRDAGDKRGHRGALFVNVTFLDVEGDPYKVKRVETHEGQTVSIWNTQMSLPSDPDYRQRARWDRGAALANVVREETGRVIPTDQPRRAAEWPRRIRSSDGGSPELRYSEENLNVGNPFHVAGYGFLGSGWHGFESALSSVPDHALSWHIRRGDVGRYVEYILDLVPGSDSLRDWVRASLPDVQTADELRVWARQLARRLRRHSPHEQEEVAAAE